MSAEEAAALDGLIAYDERGAKRHIRGWLSYAFASEVFVIVSLTLFLPICLEQFARDNGVLLSDKITPCNFQSSSSIVPEDESRCVVKIGWLWIDSASFSLYTYSFSVALQALTVISMGGIANHPPYRKKTLVIFAALGSFSAMVFFLLPSSSPLWPLAAPLAAVANVGFGASVVAMNAYIPGLAREDKEVVNALEVVKRTERMFGVSPSEDIEIQEDELDEGIAASEPLLAAEAAGWSAARNVDDANGLVPPEVQTAREKYTTTLSRATSRISSFGIALGYSAGIALLLVALVPVTKLKGSTLALRLAIGMSGVWWGIFTIPAWIWLPGSSNNVGGRVDEGCRKRDEEWRLSREILRAWKKLGQMLRWKEIKKLKNTFWFLAAWFLLSDGFTTITSTALLFGKTSLHMSPSQLILIGVLTPFAGIIGSLVWPRIQQRLGWTNRTMLVTQILLASFIPLYGCLGFLPIFEGPPPAPGAIEAQKLRFGGLTRPEEMFVLAVYFGIVYGAFQGYARAFYAELIPPGEEARWYGLFSITDKSSSFLGPLVVGIIADSTGNIRYSFFFLVVMVWIAVPPLLLVNVEQGRVDAKQYRID